MNWVQGEMKEKSLGTTFLEVYPVLIRAMTTQLLSENEARCEFEGITLGL